MSTFLKHLNIYMYTVQQQNSARNPDWEYEIATSIGFEKWDSCMVGQITENHQIVRDLQGPSHREKKGGYSWMYVDSDKSLMLEKTAFQPQLLLL